MNLKGKVAVVTGASSGIGKAIAEKLSAEGCKVALASRSLEKLAEIKKKLPTESFIA
ncbi:SDR family oxidoreductase, partial [Salegentibacter sp.]|uniref:SDR family oxidoreductase n=1 Tax=Salegentibacter sp. TaxID=1903072 RepID=UPI00356676C4